MQDNKELLLVFRIRPQSSGVLDLIPSFQKKSNTLLHYYHEGKRTEDFPCDLILDPVVDLDLFSKKNSLLLLYGNTGSGKTYSIHGDSHHEGILLHSLRRIFEISRQQNENYFVKLSVIGVYEESSVDLLGATAQPKGAYSPSNNPIYIEQRVMSFQQGRSFLDKSQQNQCEFETRERFSAADAHILYVLRLIQCTSRGSLTRPDVNGMERPVGVLRIVDLAGCESSKTVNNRGQIVFVPKRSSVSLQMLLKCLATMFAAPVRAERAAHSLSVSTFHFCQLTVLLKDHFFAKSPGNVVLIHTVANETRDVDAEARALISLLPILPKKEGISETDGEEPCVLCPACTKKRELLEEQIREKVVKEVLKRRRTESTQIPQKSGLFLEIQSMMETTQLGELLRRYDEDMLYVTAELESKT
ncbi:uncharacterized protein [Blastocystis hominis]|uniref:Kinesin motor domain-containing protein n=1 Tax=Blastocystis hominis TaxID=12968 RepID=D8LZ15_BLAHO|nr:uncharacterized protein [Blastocystis hominis]CBK21054.2 unnamed protein product [Blastocystis hominis]|eukprot:XP_012895102.1 uncharacterized protein [Blastocystis hominis]